MNKAEIASFKDLPEAIRKELDSNGGHEKLTADEIEMQEVIEDAFKEMRLFDGFQMPQIKQIWLRKNIMEHLAKKYGEPVATDNMVTDKEKAEFLVEKIKWEHRKMQMLSKGKPLSKDWADMERKARVLLNQFGQGLPEEVQASCLIDMMALFMDMMFKTGKWGK